ncbi:Wzz/FepE/Etk N-terminal domain-containing protein [Marinobacter alexandrii]|uniref:Wzz/FepE/Etk N-terminal domain-containing protein n=1 Tax=Marinobacter alexandrii TaxID=2570351 RepID=UPI00110834EA|nr:Wzz/FepE/Etk N-terminal domain-containing protein [Marinobacter alexandrii]
MTQYEKIPGTFGNLEEDEIDLRQLFAILWSGKWLIIAITFLFAVGGVAYAIYQPNIYQSTVLMAPANDDNTMGGISGQLGGLASLAGISLGSGRSNQTVIAKEVLRSRAFLASFIDRHNLAAPLMAAKGWRPNLSKWQFDRDIYDPETGKWLQDEEGKSLKPTDWDLVKVFKNNHVSISENQESGLVTLSIKSLSPEVARQWAEWLVQDINDHMRREDVARAEARIAYLEDKLSDANIAGMQQVFYQLIESETRTVMLANAQQEYVFKTIDPAVVPQEPSEPKRALIVAFATLLGGMFGVLIVFIRAALKGSTESAKETNPEAEAS